MIYSRIVTSLHDYLIDYLHIYMIIYLIICFLVYNQKVGTRAEPEIIASRPFGADNRVVPRHSFLCPL